MITITGEAEPIGTTPGDCTFVDGKGLDGSPGTEALRLCGDGRFLVRGQVETDPVQIVRALRDWTTRVLDAKWPPTTNADMPDEPIEVDARRVVIQSGAAVGEDRGLASIILSMDGAIHVNGDFVEYDDELRRNFRRVLERLRIST